MISDIEISDIQETKDDRVEITFCAMPSAEDFLTIKIDTKSVFEIADFCRRKLSYGAKLKKKHK